MPVVIGIRQENCFHLFDCLQQKACYCQMKQAIDFSCQRKYLCREGEKIKDGVREEKNRTKKKEYRWKEMLKGNCGNFLFCLCSVSSNRLTNRWPLVLVYSILEQLSIIAQFITETLLMNPKPCVYTETYTRFTNIQRIFTATCWLQWFCLPFYNTCSTYCWVNNFDIPTLPRPAEYPALCFS